MGKSSILRQQGLDKSEKRAKALHKFVNKLKKIKKGLGRSHFCKTQQNHFEGTKRIVQTLHKQRENKDNLLELSSKVLVDTTKGTVGQVIGKANTGLKFLTRQVGHEFNLPSLVREWETSHTRLPEWQKPYDFFVRSDSYLFEEDLYTYNFKSK